MAIPLHGLTDTAGDAGVQQQLHPFPGMIIGSTRS
jgi:hypothetical protein